MPVGRFVLDVHNESRSTWQASDAICAALQVINQYFLYNEMPLASGSYWAMLHGVGPEEILQDTEGLQTIRNMTRNLAHLMHSLKAAEAAGIKKPQNEYGARTSFIR